MTAQRLGHLLVSAETWLAAGGSLPRLHPETPQQFCISLLILEQEDAVCIQRASSGADVGPRDRFLLWGHPPAVAAA